MSIRLKLPTGDSAAVDRTLVVGRLPECDVVIADALVSGQHFEIGPAPGGAQILDLGSSNGTFVNGERLAGPRVLTGGEEIAIGSQKLGVERIVEAKPADLRLTVRVGPDTGRDVLVTGGTPVVIGRADDAALKLTDSLVSSRHCKVVLVRPPVGPCPHCGTMAAAGDAHCVGCGRQRVAAEVEDLGSANGTLVDGSPVSKNGRADLLEGGEIQVGDSVIVFGTATDPVQTGPAPTVIRPVPRSLDTPTGADAATPPPMPRSRRRTTLAVLVAAVAAIALVAAGVIVWKPGTSDSGGTVQSVVEQEREKTVQVLTTLGDGAGAGSGVVIDAEQGLVLTNAHVIAGGNSFQIRLYGEKKPVAATLFASLPCDDLAVLQIKNLADREGLTAATLAEPDSVTVGETVVALGFPDSAESASSVAAFATDQISATDGIISKTGAKYVVPASGVAPLPNVLQHTAAINHGNSGGPLFDLEGNLIGINTAMFHDAFGQRLEGVNYSISEKRISTLLADLRSGKANGEFGLDLFPYFGKNDTAMTKPLALEILEVAARSAAGVAGIRAGDFVLYADGKRIRDLVGYCRVIGDGQRHTITTVSPKTRAITDHVLAPRTW